MRQFRPEMRHRYEALLVQAILHVATRPERPGSNGRPEISANSRTHHLSHSRSRVDGVRRVKHPRHFRLYRVRQMGEVEIGRVLHDSMDFGRHLPDDFRADRPEQQ